MNYDINNDQVNSNSIKDKALNIWYNHKKYITIAASVLVVLIIVLILTLKPSSNTLSNYSNIERIMILNAQKYVKNNNIEGNAYISLNNLNIKIDDKYNCDTLSGVYKENGTYSP